jgi:hypothetical protein
MRKLRCAHRAWRPSALAARRARSGRRAPRITACARPAASQTWRLAVSPEGAGAPAELPPMAVVQPPGRADVLALIGVINQTVR